METQIESLNKYAAINGLIIGVISSVMSIIVWYVMPSLMGSTMYGIGMMIFSLLLYVFFTIDLRKKIGGFWSFKQALTGVFIMAFIAGILGVIVNYIFYNFVEPDAYGKIVGYVTDNLTATYERFGMDQDTIDQNVEKALESMKSQFQPTFKDILKSLGVVVLLEFVMSLIFAAIFKKEQPVFAPIEE